MTTCVMCCGPLDGTLDPIRDIGGGGAKEIPIEDGGQVTTRRQVREVFWGGGMGAHGKSPRHSQTL